MFIKQMIPNMIVAINEMLERAKKIFKVVPGSKKSTNDAAII
jgi:hypothetical protein